MKCAVYVHEIVKLCSEMCLANTIDNGVGLSVLIFVVHANGRSAIGPADGSDELAVLGKSLDSVGCSLSLDSLTET